MDKTENMLKDNAVVALNMVSKLVEDIERKVSLDHVAAKQGNEIKQLKEKCCDKNVIVSQTAFQAINILVNRRILVGSHAISTLISLLPSITHYSALVCAIGNILLFDLQEQIAKNETSRCSYNSEELHHPFITILKFNKEKTWFQLYIFMNQILQRSDIQFECKVQLLRPVFRHVFWSPSWRGSSLQTKLFFALMKQFQDSKVANFTLEILMWQGVDVYYCSFLENIFSYLLTCQTDESKIIIPALTPFLAQAIKWLILNGNDPTLWIDTLKIGLETNAAACSTVLYILTDVIMDTPSAYVNALVGVCKFIICSGSCNKYVAYKFVAVVLNWCINPSPLVNPLCKTVEEIIMFLNRNRLQWNNHTHRIKGNEYYKCFENTNEEVKFAVDLVEVSEGWTKGTDSIVCWLQNIKDSNEHRILLKLHSFIFGIILSERDKRLIDLCLDIMFRLIHLHKDISFSQLCLLFYKLGTEIDPALQKTYLFSLPKLAIKKENIPLIVGIIESLKKNSSKVMIPVVTQLYLSLWKFDNRTYSYLHKMLHDTPPQYFDWELNVSKAIALRDICRMSPHLHAKDLVSVLSNILNDCIGDISGLPSAIAIEAVTELCKAYVIDVSGTWTVIQARLRADKRPKVIISLCKFFAEIPGLDSSGQKYEKLIHDIVPMLWNYTFSNNIEVVKNALRALSNFLLEDLPLNLFPEIYRVNVKPLKKQGKDYKSSEDILSLPYIPAECWVQFMQKIEEGVLKEGGDFLTVLIERELNSLPRGLFHWPPEKSEPLSYSYLPARSICRSLVDHIRKHCAANSKDVSRYIREIIRVLSHEYSKLLPPLDWSFLNNFMEIDIELLNYCLAILVQQGSISKSANSMLDGYLKKTQWNSSRMDEAVFLCNLLPLMCKSVSYNVLQSFLENTITLCLQSALQNNTDPFEKYLENLTKALRNKAIQSGHKTLIAKQLEKVVVLIPSGHKVMNYYALCATEFSVKSIENITSINPSNEINGDRLRRSIIIRCAIAMRADIKNPLVWLNEFMVLAGNFSNEQEFTLGKILSIIRHRRSCDHSTWMQELMWRIQASTTTNNSESLEVTLFLIDVFVSATVVLAGYDCFFTHFSDIPTNKLKNMQFFPASLSILLQSAEWINLLPKVAIWLQKLSKWRFLPNIYIKVFVQSLLVLKDATCFTNENASTFPVCLHSLPII